MRMKLKSVRNSLQTLARATGSLLQISPPSRQRSDVAALARHRSCGDEAAADLAEQGAGIVREMLSDADLRQKAKAWGERMDEDSIRELLRRVNRLQVKSDIAKDKNDE